MDGKEALETAVRAAGSASALARHLGITPQAVLQWRVVPADKVLDVERLSGVSRHLLRPDVFGPEIEHFDSIIRTPPAEVQP